MKIYGYVRVSSTNQNEDRQTIELSHKNIAAKANGIRFGRPEKELLHNFASLVQLWKEKKITLPKCRSNVK